MNTVVVHWNFIAKCKCYFTDAAKCLMWIHLDNLKWSMWFWFWIKANWTFDVLSRTSGQNGVGITFETVWVLYPPSWNVLHQLAVDFRFWVSTCCITADYCITGQIQYGRKQTCSTVTLEWGETLVIWWMNEWMNRLVQVFLQVCSQMSHSLKPGCYSCEIMTCFCNKDNSECLLYNLYFETSSDNSRIFASLGERSQWILSDDIKYIGAINK